MIEYKWKILSITNEGDLVTSAHYLLSATDGQNTVETEGNYFFEGKEVKIALSELREQIIINWIVDETTKDEVCSIKSNLDNQLEALKSQKSSGLPWLANTFTPEI
jgi:hypothetical protein